MPGYSKVPRHLFADPDFRALPEDSRHLYLYLLVCPHANSFGYFIVSEGYIRDDLQWAPERLTGAWGPLIETQLVCRDERTRTVLILRALADNAPENPSVVKSWKSLLAGLPRSPLLAALAGQARLYLRQPWQLAWLPEESAVAEETPGRPAFESSREADHTGPTPSGQGEGHRVDTVPPPCPQGVEHGADIPNPNPSPSPNPNPSPNAAAARAPARESPPETETERKTRPTPAGGEQTLPGVAGGAGETLLTPCPPGAADRAETLEASAIASPQVTNEGRSPPGTACGCYQNTWGFLPGGQHDRDTFLELDGRYSPDWLEAAFRECADSGHTCRNFKYLRKVLERWEVEGFKSPRKEKGVVGVQTNGRGAHWPGWKPVQPIEFQEDYQG